MSIGMTPVGGLKKGVVLGRNSLFFCKKGGIILISIMDPNLVVLSHCLAEILVIEKH